MTAEALIRIVYIKNNQPVSLVALYFLPFRKFRSRASEISVHGFFEEP